MIIIMIIIIINMLMPAPVIVFRISEPYWCSRHRGIGPI
jgi:hypothetical protein